jgi:hypothetical protein
VARFTAQSASDAIVDQDSGGRVAGLVLEQGYRGAVTLKRDLTVSGEVLLAGGSFAQGDYSLSARHYSQSGGTFTGGRDKLTIDGEARVSGGTLITPGGLMKADSLVIDSPGVVRMAANGKLELSGSGEVLRGNGLLDTSTNRPNSVEYTGQTSGDLTAAGPARELAGIGHLGRSKMRSKFQSAEANEPIMPAGFEWVGTLTLNSGEEALLCAVIDPGGGFAYFGTATFRGIVVKVRLSDFTRVGALTLNYGEGGLSSAVIDASGGFA